MKRKAFYLLGLMALTALAAAGGGAAWAWQYLHRPFSDYPGDELLITFESGIGAGTILSRLEAKGVLPDARLARAYLVYGLDDPSLKAGEYHFTEPLNTPQVLDRLIRGQVVTYPVTLIEGLTIDEIADTLAAKGFGDAETFQLEMRRSDLIADLDPEAENLEGYLYPDTYSFARGTEESEVVATLVRTFRKRFTDEVVPLLEARKVKRTVRELGHSGQHRGEGGADRRRA